MLSSPVVLVWLALSSSFASPVYRTESGELQSQQDLPNLVTRASPPTWSPWHKRDQNSNEQQRQQQEQENQRQRQQTEEQNQKQRQQQQQQSSSPLMASSSLAACRQARHLLAAQDQALNSQARHHPEVRARVLSSLHPPALDRVLSNRTIHRRVAQDLALSSLHRAAQAQALHNQVRHRLLLQNLPLRKPSLRVQARRRQDRAAPQALTVQILVLMVPVAPREGAARPLSTSARTTGTNGLHSHQLLAPLQVSACTASSMKGV